MATAPKVTELHHSHLRSGGNFHAGDGASKFGPSGGIGKGTPHHDPGVKPGAGKPVSSDRALSRQQRASHPIGKE